jgi:hypothetical protein
MTKAQLIPYLPWFFYGFFLIAWPFALLLVAWRSGWSALAQRYRASQLSGELYRMRSGAFRHLGIRGIQYRGILSFYIGDQGLGLSVFLPFRIGHRALLIPWRDIQYRGEKKYFLQTFNEFSIGTPPITTLFLWRDKAVDQIRSKLEGTREGSRTGMPVATRE